jgi:hypothetical protein
LEFTIPLTHGHPRRPYQPGDFDLLAAYVGPYKTWYIIPFPEIAGRSGIHFYTHNPASTGQFEKFKERWDLLGGTRFPPSRHNEGT